MAAIPSVSSGERERAQALLEMGFDATQALLLAATQSAGCHIDLGQLQRMLDGGCDHELALRIVL
jgi:hypothetical protein